MTRRVLPLFLLFAAAAPRAVLAETVKYTKHSKNEVREGPGSYYPLKAVLFRGAPVPVVKTQDDWAQVRLEEFTGDKKASGWIAASSLIDKPAEKGWLEKVRQGFGKDSASRAVAAVRGFALKYGRAKESDLAALERLRPPFFSPEEYQRFKQEAGLRPGRVPEEHRAALAGYEPEAAEEGVGLGIAASVASRGLVEDRERLRYLNMLAAWLAEGTGFHAYPFKVYVTRGKELNALAVPGGHVFISEALLAACRDEAELAAVLAHELMHVVRRHGLKELKAQDVRMKSADAFDELEQEAGRGPAPEDEAELEDFADAAYDAVTKPRQQSYEEEADRGAALLLARAGYDVKALARMIERVGREAAKGQDTPFLQMDFKKRQDRAEAFAKRLRARPGSDNQGRFQRYAR